MSDNPATGDRPPPAQAGRAPLPRNAANWATKVDRLTMDSGGGLNVAGRRLTGPVQGFGKMWRKTYWIELSSESSPRAVIATWKRHFGEFWPRASRFKGPLIGLSPGDVALLDVSVGGGVRLSTGVFVLYADEESFTLMTPQGHMFAGWITFSAERSGPVTVVQAQVLMRANDPLYELAMACGGHRKEDQFWIETLTALARTLGAASAVVHRRTVCVDARRQWRNAGQIWHNSMVRTTIHVITSALARKRQPAPGPR
jgi:hypothetical protein